MAQLQQRVNRKARRLAVERLEDRCLLSAYPLADINPGGLASDPSQFTVVHGIAFFSAFSPFTGEELWRTDGTPAGTWMVRDLNPGFESSRPAGFVNVGGVLLFLAQDGVHGRELWRSDGTETGTFLVKDINPGRFGSTFSVSDRLTEVNGVAFFAAGEPVAGTELWASDGSAAGTWLVKDLLPGVAEGFPLMLTPVGGQLFFAARGPAGNLALWVSGGWDEVTYPVPGLDGDVYRFGNLVDVNGVVYFSAQDAAHGYELWRADGAGAALVKDIAPGSADSQPRWLANIGGMLYFAATDPVHGAELWRSDGTAEGTVLAADIGTTDGPLGPLWLTNLNGTLLFSADDGIHGQEPWAFVPGGGPGAGGAASGIPPVEGLVQATGFRSMTAVFVSEIEERSVAVNTAPWPGAIRRVHEPAASTFASRGSLAELRTELDDLFEVFAEWM